jgi:hypothetical protein
LRPSRKHSVSLGRLIHATIRFPQQQGACFGTNGAAAEFRHRFPPEMGSKLEPGSVALFHSPEAASLFGQHVVANMFMPEKTASG